MIRATRHGWLGEVRWGRALALASTLCILLMGAAMAARAGLAWGAPFERGDVFLTGSGNVQEYSPSGQLQQTVAGTAGATALCFDPSGRHLILPGVGLFDSSGNMLPSHWSSVTSALGGSAVRCVADGLGDVYVTAPQTYQSPWQVTKYDIQGDAVQTFTVAPYPAYTPPLAIDIAPDECTIYYGEWNPGSTNSVGRFNACTQTQDSPLTQRQGPDDLRVLPNSQVLQTEDAAGLRYGASGQFLTSYVPTLGTPGISDSLRTMSLDPDGTSFWMSGAGVARFDINSGALISEWGEPQGGNPATAGGPIAVYSPPLLGNAEVEGTVDSDSSGTAEAFSTQAGYSGQLSRLHFFVDSSATASQVVVGLYSDHHGRPGALKARGTITGVTPGSWNYVDVPPIWVTAGRRYWVAVLGPHDDGTIRFRDATGGGLSYTSAQHNLTTLPARWSSRTAWSSTSLSAYGS